MGERLSALRQLSASRPEWVAAALSVFLLGAYTEVMWLEWVSDDQYGHGVFVPVLTAVLLWRRWRTRPEPSTGTGGGPRPRWAAGVIVGLMVGALPFHILHGANPEWRLLLWAMAVATATGGAAIAALIGGRAWLRHFAPAWVLLLLAVPWPTQLESAVTGGLMRSVAAVVGELLAVLGIFAQRFGNVIHLADGPVGVAEACSGIRSFQLSLTMGYFLAEVARLSARRRVMVIVAVLAVAYGLNVARTLALVLLVANGGPEVMAHWHDGLGLAVMLALLGAVYAGVQLLRKPDPGTEPAPRKGTGSAAAKLPRWVAVGLPLAYLGAATTAMLYFEARAGTAATAFLVLREEALPPTWEPAHITPEVRAQLRYSHSAHGRWRPGAKMRAECFLFSWGAGRVSSFAGIHRPETCLPAAGWEMAERFPNRSLTLPNSATAIPVQSYRFEQGGAHVHVFFALWDRLGTPADFVTHSVTDRLRNALAGRRIDGRQSLQVIIRGADTIDAAWAATASLLQQSAAVTNTPPW